MKKAKTVKTAKADPGKKKAKRRIAGLIKEPRSLSKKTNDKEINAIAMQSLLLGSNELLLYKDEHGEYHVLCKEAYNPKKDYQVIYLTHEDIYD